MMLENIVKNLYDFTSISIPEKMLQINIVPELLDKGMREAATKFLTIHAEEDEIRSGDIVALELDGEFIRVNVGRGFAEEALEQGLYGKKVGDTLEPYGKIVSVHRRHIPELTDDLVQKIGIEGVSDAAGYREYLFQEAVNTRKETKLSAIVKYLTKELLECTEFNDIPVDHPAVIAMRQNYMAQIEALAAERSISTRDILVASFGFENVNSDEDAERALYLYIANLVRTMSLGWCYAEQDGIVYTESSVMAEMEQLAQTENIPVESIVGGRGLDVIVLEMYNQYLSIKFRNYYQDKFLVTRG